MLIRILRNTLILFYNPIKFIYNVNDFVKSYLVQYILNNKLPIFYKNKKIFMIRNFGAISKMRASSFEIKEPETLRWIQGLKKTLHS